MPQRSKKSTRRSSRSCRLPDKLNEYVVHHNYLRHQGFYPAIAESMRVDGWRGHDGADVFNFILGALSTGAEGGFDGFYHDYRDYFPSMAAVAGRKMIGSDSSTCRYLRSVDEATAVDVGRQLTLVSAAQKSVTDDPRVMVRDANGRGFHVIDTDYTMDAFRRRRLVESEAYPEPKRLPEELASPAGPTRKRGQVHLSRGLIYHSGSGHWLGTFVHKGGGVFEKLVNATVDYIESWCSQSGICRDQVILRMDGAGGHGACIAAVKQAGLHVLTRLSRYELFSHRSLQQRLNRARWYEAPSSESGKVRYVADAGMIRMPVNSPHRGDWPAEVDLRLIVARSRLHKSHRGPVTAMVTGSMRCLARLWRHRDGQQRSRRGSTWAGLAPRPPSVSSARSCLSIFSIRIIPSDFSWSITSPCYCGTTGSISATA